jgi:hypothetical protein
MVYFKGEFVDSKSVFPSLVCELQVTLTRY